MPYLYNKVIEHFLAILNVEFADVVIPKCTGLYIKKKEKLHLQLTHIFKGVFRMIHFKTTFLMIKVTKLALYNKVIVHFLVMLNPGQSSHNNTGNDKFANAVNSGAPH